MNFDKESKSEGFFFFFFWGGGGGAGGEREGGGRRGIPTEKKKIQKTIGIRLFFALMLYINFQIPESSGSLVLTQTKEVMDR